MSPMALTVRRYHSPALTAPAFVNVNVVGVRVPWSSTTEAFTMRFVTGTSPDKPTFSQMASLSSPVVSGAPPSSVGVNCTIVSM